MKRLEGSGGRRRKRWRIRLGLAALVLGVGFVACELLARELVGVPLVERLPVLTVRSNPLRGFEMVQGVHYTYHHEVHVNALTLRGPELGPRAEDELRVLALGDSLVYGQGVGEAETLPFHLERELEARDPVGRPWTVLNGGHRGYDTPQELGLLRELVDEVQPDIVVLFWFWNDFLERDIETTFARLERKGPVVYDTGNRLEGRQLWEWRAVQLLRRSAFIMYLWDRFGSVRSEPFGQDFYDKGFARLGRYLDRFRTSADDHGFRAVVAVLPDPNRLLGQHFTDRMDERTRDLALEKGFPVIEFVDELRELTGEEGELPVIPHDGHYLPQANLRMAEVAAEALLGLSR